MKTILLIEDDRDFRKLLRTSFVIDGFSVREAADGYQALSWLDQQPFDAIVLDLGLPIVDGHSVLADIRQKSPVQRPALVVVTGADGAEFEDLDVDSLLKKPVTADHVVATVRKYLNP
jgi:DNA-binding response OmpR family regulator